MLVIFEPMRFNEIPGQDAIRARLLQAVKTNRVSHALMLSGSAGSGHFSLALALAQYLQCTSPVEDDSCGVCPACHQAAQFVHPISILFFRLRERPKSRMNHQATILLPSGGNTFRPGLIPRWKDGIMP